MAYCFNTSSKFYDVEYKVIIIGDSRIGNFIFNLIGFYHFYSRIQLFLGFKF